MIMNNEFGLQAPSNFKILDNIHKTALLLDNHAKHRFGGAHIPKEYACELKNNRRDRFSSFEIKK